MCERYTYLLRSCYLDYNSAANKKKKSPPSTKREFRYVAEKCCVLKIFAMRFSVIYVLTAVNVIFGVYKKLGEKGNSIVFRMSTNLNHEICTEFEVDSVFHIQIRNNRLQSNR